MGYFKKLLERKTFVTCVILAAGSSERMNGWDKLFQPLSGKPVLAYSLEAFEACPDISELVVVAREDAVGRVMELCSTYAPKKTAAVVCGGSTRAKSALNGVLAASKNATHIAIHDGARPLVTEKLITDVVSKAKRTGAAIPTVPVTDTVKLTLSDTVESTPRRELLCCAQTPQVFDSALIKAALTAASEKKLSVSDDSQAVELLGMKVSIVTGDPDNIKLTLRRDLATAEAILAGRSEA